MSEDPQNIAASVRDGSYFKASRAWYSALYISPISERTLFAIIAALAVLVCLMALAALSALLPVTTELPVVVYANGKMEEVEPKLVELNPNKKDVNEVLQRMFVERYVRAREAYASDGLARNRRFVKAQSADEIYETYYNDKSATGPLVLASQLGLYGRRDIEIESIRLSKGTPSRAQVTFTATTSGVGDSSKSEWTTALEYNYTALVAEEKKDPDTGEEVMDINDPKFQVVKYVVEAAR